MTRLSPPLRTDTAERPAGLEVLLRRVEDRLRSFLVEQTTYWDALDGRAAVPVRAVADLIDAGGKRLRPRLCLTGYLAAGGEPAELPVQAAAALELLHASALIHDDVMDEADERRARATVHARYRRLHRARGWQGDAGRYGESVAILAGDLAWVYADHFMADLPDWAKDEWFELRTELVVGQMLDLAAAAELDPDPDLVRDIAALKSGRYTILRPLLLGAALAGRKDLVEPFWAYGTALGEAFQLRDDLIDAFGDRSASGKPSGQDTANGKMTLLLAVAMRQDERLRAPAQHGNTAELRARLAATSARAAVETRIDDLVEQALAALTAADVNEVWRRELARCARAVAYREV
ncbi:polyprenyl synthetase family protein [Streptomyces sp. NPDC006733]|uniref:polyprenyl synthetase family protein n=1 Tax=Streptomyces sp. NPDC006733 TaxID=3155460 RepID=UPI0033F1B094